MSSTMGTMGTPHTPTMKWMFIGIIALFVGYHFTLGKGKR